MHATVLLKEAIDELDLKEGDVMVDGTLGAGGHSLEVCERFGKGVKIIALDADTESIEKAKARLSGADCDITFMNANFKDIDAVLEKIGLQKVDAILLDLGWSSDQLEDGGRGLSFRRDEPLVMTLKSKQGPEDFSAADIVNGWSEEDIANVIYAYGEERFARRIAREIVEAREKEPITTTTRLVAIIMSAVPTFYRHGKIHPATRTFQALRIAVNNELENLKTVLVKGFHMLNPTGRIAIITFHSLEDRIVKNFFKDMERENLGRPINKKPLTPSDEELSSNPRSRSAKLRILEKI